MRVRKIRHQGVIHGLDPFHSGIRLGRHCIHALALAPLLLPHEVVWSIPRSLLVFVFWLPVALTILDDILDEWIWRAKDWIRKHYT